MSVNFIKFYFLLNFLASALSFSQLEWNYVGFECVYSISPCSLHDGFYWEFIVRHLTCLICIFFSQVHLDEAPGDILVFLTGQEEIESVERLVQERLLQLPEASRKLVTVPIFSSLPSEQQMKVFAPAAAGFRKVIVGALTSLQHMNS